MTDTNTLQAVDYRDVVIVLQDLKNNLGKTYTLTDGGITKQSNVLVSKGLCRQFHVPDAASFTRLLEEVSGRSDCCIIPDGIDAIGIDEPFYMVSRSVFVELFGERERNEMVGVHDYKGKKIVVRLKENFTPGRWKPLDRDDDEHTPSTITSLDRAQWLRKVNKLLPIKGATMVSVPSQSSRVLLGDVPMSKPNVHTWIRLQNPEALSYARLLILNNAAANGLLWGKPRLSRANGDVIGQTSTTLIDISTFNTGRLVFEGKPAVSAGLSVKPFEVEMQCGHDVFIDTNKLALGKPKYIEKRLKAAGLNVTVRIRDHVIKLSAQDLTLNEDIELADGSFHKLRDLIALGEPMRVQSPFRASRSMAGKLGFGHDGRPYIFDSDGITHWLTTEDWNQYNEAGQDVTAPNPFGL